MKRQKTRKGLTEKEGNVNTRKKLNWNKCMSDCLDKCMNACAYQKDRGRERQKKRKKDGTPVSVKNDDDNK